MENYISIKLTSSNITFITTSIPKYSFTNHFHSERICFVLYAEYGVVNSIINCAYFSYSSSCTLSKYSKSNKEISHHLNNSENCFSKSISACDLSIISSSCFCKLSCRCNTNFAHEYSGPIISKISSFTFSLSKYESVYKFKNKKLLLDNKFLLSTKIILFETKY